MPDDTPAGPQSIAACKGKIVPGADVDLVALDDQGFVQYTWTRGMLAYRCKADGDNLRTTRNSRSAQKDLLKEAR
jgi:hypothetical protein